MYVRSYEYTFQYKKKKKEMQHHNSLITMITTHAATTMPSTRSMQRTSLHTTPTPPSSKRSRVPSSVSINEKKRAKMAGEGEQEGDR
jgi:hypothetical protein